MIKLISILVVLLFTIGCNSKRASNSLSVDTTSLANCPEHILKRVYFEPGCNGDKCGYFHTVMLDKYDESCFDDYDFVYLADKYLDSVRHRLPVKAIRFVKPFQFQPNYDSGDVEPLNALSIVQISYTDSTMHQKVPQIGRISVWSNGQSRTLEYLEVSNRRQRMNYYNSKK